MIFSVSLAVSCAIFFLIAIRQWLPETVRIWHIMTAGAAVLLVAGEISPLSAASAVDWNVIAYLFGVFSIGSALYDAGISHAIGNRITNTDRPELSFLIFILATAVCAAVLTNDAAAVIGTPIALMLARALKWSPTVLLVTLCATVTVGSMVSPVGNPQNILIATSGDIGNPIGTFVWWLAVPTLASLAFVYAWMSRLVNRSAPAAGSIPNELPPPSSDPRTWPTYLATVLLVVLIGADSALQASGSAHIVPFGAASLVACAPVFLFSNRRFRIFREVDWATLVFFVSMFVVTGSLLASGSLQALLGSLQERLDEPTITAVLSFWASQLFSNVPVVDIYLKLLQGGEAANLMMLAGISTLAGNLFIISAASNVIVVQQAEKFGQVPFNFWQFTLLVLPVTAVSVALTYGWIVWLAAMR
ncbi:SLC13 family permease [Microbaculum marinum]|uniref:SLC13 family permease n=1 Tax=Microbaculum marinum TaxID=1764581 RepID=A0AAW9RGE9_9HYPH